MRFHRRPDGSMPDEDDGDAWLWLIRGTGQGDYLARLRKLEQTWCVALCCTVCEFADNNNNIPPVRVYVRSK